MKKQIFVLQKESGNLSSMLGIFLVMIFVFIMMLTTLSYTQAVMVKIECNSIARKYLGIMERNGYLSNDMKNSMIQELESLYQENGTKTLTVLGFENEANTKQTTSVQVPYGKEVLLVCRMQYQSKVVDPFSLKTSKEGIIFEIYMSSSAKW